MRSHRGVHTKRLGLSFGSALLALAVAAMAGLAAPAAADETCNSPYMANLIKGQEDYVYVWTLGVTGMGDGWDKLVTIDANPASKALRQGDPQAFGRRARRGAPHGLHRRPPLPVGGRARRQQDLRVRRRHRSRAAEARPHASPTCRRRPATSARTRSTRCPAACWSRALSNTKDNGGVTGMAIYSNTGRADHDVRHADHRRRRRLRLRHRDQPAEERHADLELHRLEQLHDGHRQADQGRRGDEALRQHHGGVGPQGDEAEEGLRRAGRAAGDPLVAQGRRQLGDHRLRADLEDLADQAGRQRRVAGEGRRRHRRPGEDPAAGRHQHHRRRQGAVGQHVHGRQDALLRPDQPGGAEADLREGHRQAGQHGVARAGTASASTSPRRCSPTGTRRAPTTSSSCAPSTGTARS